jgi:hypothetical protein
MRKTKENPLKEPIQSTMQQWQQQQQGGQVDAWGAAAQPQQQQQGGWGAPAGQSQQQNSWGAPASGGLDDCGEVTLTKTMPHHKWGLGLTDDCVLGMSIELAKEAGIPQGSKVTHIDNIPVSTSAEVAPLVNGKTSVKVTFTRPPAGTVASDDVFGGYAKVTYTLKKTEPYHKWGLGLNEQLQLALVADLALEMNIPQGATLVGVDNIEVKSLAQVGQLLDGKATVELTFVHPGVNPAMLPRPISPVKLIRHGDRTAASGDEGCCSVM